ncbi:MAG: polysaccharide biosynthesis tyrosine autokinase [Anaerolineae bacterium]|nr:polysaccharide biosynthesis tyrosine autokinase [Anaerolineae bacterium]
MELRDFIDTLWRRKWIIVATIIVAVSVAGVGSFLVTPIYTASALIRVSAAPNPLIERADVQYVVRIMNTYTIMARSWPLLESVINELNLDVRPAQLSGTVEVQVLEETELIRITVTNTNPTEAANIANALANGLIAQTNASVTEQGASEAVRAQMDQVQQELTDLQNEYNQLLIEDPGNTTRIAEISRESVIKQQTYETLLAQYDQTRLLETMRINAITLIEPATAPNSPSSPRRNLNILLGGVLGLMGGVGLVLLLNNLDKRVYTPSQIQSIVRLPILAEIYKSRHSELSLLNMPPIQREAYRRLRVNIFSLQKDMSLKTILVTSGETDEGKSTIVSNLAMSIAQLGLRVLIVDCDLRRPTQHKIFNLPNEIGLSTVLEKKVSLTEAIQSTNVQNLKVLTSGLLPDDPTALLTSSYMKNVLQELGPKFDIVLLDAPALMPVIDSAVLAPLADGVLQIVRCGQSRSDTIANTLAQIAEVQAHPIGLVLNDTPRRMSNYYTSPQVG